MNTLITNGKIVGVGKKHGVTEGDIFIKDSLISRIGKNLSVSIKNEKIDKNINATGKYIIPGFVQTHVHLCQTLFRGLAEDFELLDWLEKKMWPLEASHTEKTMRKSAEIGISELVSSGTTTIVDMGTAQHTNAIFEVAGQAGIRAFIGNAMMDTGNIPEKLLGKTSNIIKTSLSLIEKFHGTQNGRLNYILSPRFILTCSDDLFREVKKISENKNVLIQTHAAENLTETNNVKTLKGKNEIHYLQDIELLGDKLILAHCIWLEEEDLDILCKQNVRVAHCPTVNLKLSSGIAKIVEMLEKNILVSLGADGAPCNNNLNMFNEMKLAGLLQKYRTEVKALPAKKIFDMATIDGAKVIHVENDIGSVEEGKKADLALLDLNKSNTLPEIDDIYTRIVYSSDSQNVETVIVDGRVIFSKQD